MTVDLASIGLVADTSGLAKGEAALLSLAAAGERTEAALKDSLGRGVPAAADAAADAVKASTAAQRAAFESVRASLDPLFAASRRYEAVQEQVSAAVRAGAASQAEANRVLAQAEARYLGLTPVVERAGLTVAATGASATRAGTSAFQAGGGFRSLGQQLSQVAQQGAVTGNYLGALAVQLPDLALGFGGVAIAASIVATIAIPALISAFGGGQTAAERARDSLDELDAALSAFNANATIGATSIATLKEQYGEWADEVQRTAQWMAQVNVGQAVGELQKTTLTFSTALDEVAAAQARVTLATEAYNRAKDQAAQGLFSTETVLAYELALNRAAEATGELATTLGLTTTQALSMQTALSDVRAATSMADLAAKATTALDVINAMYPAGTILPPVIAESAAALQRVRDAAAQGLATMADMPGALNSATGAANGLAGAMGNVAQAANAALSRMIQLDLQRRTIQAAAQRQAQAPGGVGPAGQSDGGLAYASVQARKLADDAAKAAAELARLPPVFKAIGSSGGAAGGGVSKAMKDAAKATKEAEKAAEGYAKAWQQPLSDAVDATLNAVFGGLKGGFKDLWKIFTDTLKRMAVFALSNPIKIALGLGGSVAGGAVSAATSVASGGGLLGALGGITTTLAGIGQGLAGIFSGGGLSASFANLGGLLSGGAAGLGAIGAALPAAGIVAALIALPGLFKKEIIGSGLSGQISGESFTGQSYVTTDTKFRNPRNEFSALGADAEAQIAASVAGVRAGVLAAAKSLGIASNALDGFAASFNVSTTGLSAEQASEALAAAISNVGEQMAMAVGPVGLYGKAGETATQAITRLAASLDTVNPILALLGQRVFDVSLAGGAAASALADAFGGLDQLRSATESYFSLFYSEQEQVTQTTKALSDQLAKLGVAMPTTRDQFRAMVDGADLTTHAGRTLYAALVGLSGAFDKVLPKVDEFTGAVSDGLVKAMKRLNVSGPIFRNDGLESPAERIAVASRLPAPVVNIADRASPLVSVANQVERAAQSTALPPVVNIAERIERAAAPVVNVADRAPPASPAVNVAPPNNVVNFTPPSQRQAAPNAVDFSAVVSELKSLRDEQRQLGIQQARNGKKMADILDRWSVLGIPLDDSVGAI
jgi:hypothetical protein